MASDVEVLRAFMAIPGFALDNLLDGMGLHITAENLAPALSSAISALEALERHPYVVSADGGCKVCEEPQCDPRHALEVREAQPKMEGMVSVLDGRPVQRMGDARWARLSPVLTAQRSREEAVEIREEVERARASEAALSERVAALEAEVATLRQRAETEEAARHDHGGGWCGGCSEWFCKQGCGVVVPPGFGPKCETHAVTLPPSKPETTPWR